MYKDSIALSEELQQYASPKSRLTRMIRSGEVIQVRRGIYLDGNDSTASLKTLANIIYGPSYLSFEYALSFYGLIPERVSALTSAVYNKNKNKTFSTPVGVFYYYYLPISVYPYGVEKHQENGSSFLMASPEKAFMDALYRTRDITSKKALQALLIEDWRCDIDLIVHMDRDALEFLAPRYMRKVHTIFLTWLKERHA